MQDKHKLFVLEYLKDFNATQAAIRAGYSKNTARQQGSLLLTKLDIQAQIQNKLNQVEITAFRVLGELSKVAFADIGDYVTVKQGGVVEAHPFEELEFGATRAIKKVKEKKKILASKNEADDVIIESQYEFEMHDKLKALELLGKHLGLFKEGVQLSGNADASAIEITFKRPE